MMFRSRQGGAAFSVGCVLVAACFVRAAEPNEGSGPAAPVVQPLTTRTVAEVGRSRIVPFAVKPPPAHDHRFTVSVSVPDTLTVLEPPTVLAGQTWGFMRIRGAQRGQVQVQVGAAVLHIDVVPERVSLVPQRVPRLSGPTDGAMLWGRVSIGVSQILRPHEPLDDIVLQLPDGSQLQPYADSERQLLPHREVVFELDTATQPSGPLTLQPAALPADRPPLPGTAVTVTVSRPEDLDLLTVEAEKPFDVDRPQRFADARHSVGRDPQASGGAFFASYASNPALCVPVHVARDGWYQLVVRAAGSRGGGVVPTIGVVIDGADRSQTNGRLLHTVWHRLAVGVPVHLSAGRRVITPFFANDFFVPERVDRNLYLDTIELARLPVEEATVTDGSETAQRAPATAVSSEPAMSAMASAGMMSMMGGSAAGNTGDDPLGVRAAGLRIGWVRPLDNAPLPGVIELAGRCWRANVEQAAAPRVTLFVNGTPIAEQVTFAPRFWVDPSHFQAGPNTVQLVARTERGEQAGTPLQTLRWHADAARDAMPPRTHHRFGIHEPAWGADVAERLQAKHHPRERRAAAFSSNGSAELTLPQGLSGAHRVFLHMRGDAFEGQARATLRLRTAQGTKDLGDIEASQWWELRRGDVHDFPEGPKTLIVAFENDHFQPDVGDRNLWLEAVLLAREPLAADRAAPIVELIYPPEGHNAWQVDAIVAEAFDNASLNNAELLVDDVVTAMVTHLNLKPGRVVFPLLLQGLSPGPHRVAVRARDVAGNLGLSQTHTIHVAPQAPGEPGPYARAVWLLNRLAYGPDPLELAAILTMGERAWLSDRLSAPFDTPGEMAALSVAWPYFPNRNEYEVSRRVLSHLMHTPNPLRARFVLWAENHFSTWVRKAGPQQKWDEHIAFSGLGVAPFADLLEASAHSAAMLTYLDQDRSFVGRINENYAREIMELHTLGVDGSYDQQDVTRLARLLTGCTVAMEGDGRGGGDQARRWSFRFDPRLNDSDAITLLGQRFDAAEGATGYARIGKALELLSAHPDTALFVSRSLAEHYVCSPAPQDLVEALRRVFLETAGDMHALMLAMCEHPRFWDAPERMATALDFAMRLCRTTDHYNPWQVGDFLARSGQGLFERVAPDGYPEDDAAYSSANALLQRWRLVRDMDWRLASLVPGQWRYGAQLSEPDWAEKIIDALAVRLIGQPLTGPSRQAALQLLAESTGNRDTRTLTVAPFVAQLPEVNTR